MMKKLRAFKSISVMSILTVYLINAFFQRQHLFVWSVFAPKLIYDLAYLIIEISLIYLNLIFSYILF